jgi:asparagine synthase (glutamine-hydrolysing)
MSNFFGIIKKQQDYTLPSIQALLKDSYAQEDCIFCFEEDFDVSIYENPQLLIMLSGFISNMAELCPKDNITPVSHAEALAQIYLNHPKSFQEMLLGNFAISIFDKKTKDLTLVRDHFGARPLYLLDHANFFSFATDMSLLIKTEIVPLHLNKNAMIDYLSLRVRDDKNTFYREIERLEASNIIRLIATGTETGHYEHVPTHKLAPYQHPVDEFGSKFEDAVRASHFSKNNIGLMLSGGLDSSAIAIGMKNVGIKDVETFSVNYTHLPKKQQALTDETNFQIAVGDATGYHHNFIPLENVSPLTSIEKQLTYFHEPVHMPNLYLFEQVAFQAKRKNIDIMFDGQDGDNVISHGAERFPELLKRLNIIGFLYEIFRYSAFNKVKLKNTAKFFVSHILLKWGLRKLPRGNSSILRDSVFFDKRFFLQPFRTGVDSHQEKLASPMHSMAFEWRYLFFKYYKIEVRSPFYSMTLIKFCLSLPGRWKLRHGKTRYILRRYLKDQVSDLVSQRHKKANLAHGVIHNITRDDIKKIKRELDNIHPFLESIVDRDRLLDCIESLEDRGTATDSNVTTVLAFYAANTWLHRNKGLVLL